MFVLVWDHLSNQSTITLNMQHTLQIDPSKAAYKQLNEHKCDYQHTHTPEPLGMRAVIYVDAVTRLSCRPRGLDAWYGGPYMDHYCYSNLCVPRTESIQKSGLYGP